MSSETDPASASNVQGADPNLEQMFWAGRGTDWYLQELVSIVNSSAIEFGITLHVHGAVVSGLLISGRKYFKAFADDFAGAYLGDDEGREAVRAALASHSKIYDEIDKQEEPSPPQYIHLMHSRTFSPGGSTPSKVGVLWRGKISAVSGFSLGSLSVD